MTSSSSVTFTNNQLGSIDIIADIHGGVVANGVQCHIWSGDHSSLINVLSCQADAAQYVSFECDDVVLKVTLRLDKVLHPTFFLNCTNSQGLSYTKPLDPADAVDVIKTTSASYDSVTSQFIISLDQIALPSYQPVSFSYVKVIETYSNGTIVEHKDVSPEISANKTTLKSNYLLVVAAGKVVELEFEVISNTGYLQMVRREIMFPTIEVVSDKKTFTTNSSFLDSLHNITVKSVYQKNFVVDYINDYYINNILVASMPKSEYKFKPPTLDGCYNFQVEIKSEKTFPYLTPLISKCLKAGVKMEVDFERGQVMGKSSIYDITLNVTDTVSCIALDFGDGTAKIFKESGTPETVCSGWGENLPGASFETEALRGSSLIQTRHTYVTNGTYTVRAIAINDFHRQKEELVVSVMTLDCSSPVISLLGAY